MKATTLRFSEALWDHLSEAAALAGVSVAQYVRDAALIRLTHEAARRGVNDYDDALLAMTSDNPASTAGAVARRGARAERETGADIRASSHETRGESAAVRAQSRQTASRVGEVRSEIEDRRKQPRP